MCVLEEKSVFEVQSDYEDIEISLVKKQYIILLMSYKDSSNHVIEPKK